MSTVALTTGRICEVIASNCLYAEFILFAHLNEACRQAAQAIFWRRVVGRVGAFLVGYNAAPRAKSNACDMFFDIVCATDSALVGSVVLALVTLSAALDESTQAGTEHYNLNIIAPHAYRKQWQKLLELEFGFKRPSRLRASTTPAAEFQGHATTKWTFVRGVKVINIVWSVSPNILRTVFAAKVTAEMNILTRNHVISFYPRHTMERSMLLAWPGKHWWDRIYSVHHHRPLATWTRLEGDNSWMQRPCGIYECPRLWRCATDLKGAGIFHFGEYPDVSPVFVDNNIIWRIGQSCSNTMCEFKGGEGQELET